MKVVHVVSGLGWDGGMQEYVSGLSRGLHDLGHEVVILSGGRPPPDGPRPHVLAEGLDVRWHPKKRVAGRYLYPTGLWSSLRGLRRWADVVHAHQPFAVGTWLAALGRSPLAANLHLHPEHLEGPAGRRHRRQLGVLLRRLDLLVTVSDAERQLIGTVGAPRGAAVVWPGLTAVPEPRGASDRVRPLVLYVGRLSATKGLDLMLRAMAMLPSDVEIAVVGGGPEADRCRALCLELGRSPDEVLRGDSVTDEAVAELMARADVFVSASRQEAFGIAPLKAIAHGCRAVLSDLPSHREIVTTLGLDDSLLFDPTTEPRDLAQLIRSAIDAPPPSADVLARIPTWKVSAARVVEAYRSMLEGRPVRRARQRRPDSSSTSR